MIMIKHSHLRIILHNGDRGTRETKIKICSEDKKITSYTTVMSIYFYVIKLIIRINMTILIDIQAILHLKLSPLRKIF